MFVFWLTQVSIIGKVTLGKNINTKVFKKIWRCAMSSVVVDGTQWGDEGKGKITDFLSQNAEVVARYQGGNSAGHTNVFVVVAYQLHLIPSGIFFKEKKSELLVGMVIDPNAFME